MSDLTLDPKDISKSLKDSLKGWEKELKDDVVGINAETSPALVSIIGSPVKDPPPSSSETFAQRSNSLE